MEKTILAIDPGTTESGFVMYRDMEILDKGKIGNNLVLDVINDYRIEVVVIEMIASYGMSVGAEVFETCVWIGRFLQQADICGLPVARLYKKQPNDEIGAESINQCICKNNKAGDDNIRQAIIDMYPATGGGKVPQKGIKSDPGLLYGMSGDMWSALAVALTYQQSREYAEVCKNEI